MSDKNSVSMGHRTFEGLRGHRVQDHIEDVLDMVEIGSGAMRAVGDFRLLAPSHDASRTPLKELGHE